MKSEIYNQAKYYEIAFSFVDTEKQITLFEKFIKEYSKIKVKKVLDIACGPSLQLREFAKRNYTAFGIDLNPQMISYLKKVSQEEGVRINAIKADMNKFHLPEKVDFVYILMGSIIYTKNNISFLSHLDSVATALKSGGLYLIENVPMDWSSPKFLKAQSWTMRKKDIKVKTTHKITPKNAPNQIVTQTLKFEVNDNGKQSQFVDINDLKIIFPEEFKLLVKINNKFEFIGFFERYQTKKLYDKMTENIILLRKK